MKLKKNLISLIRVLVKPEFQDREIKKIEKSKERYPTTVIHLLDTNVTAHGIRVRISITDDLFECYKPYGWNEYPKFSPEENGFYYVKFSNGSVYMRQWVNGEWWDNTGENRSKGCVDITEFKFYKKEL